MGDDPRSAGTADSSRPTDEEAAAAKRKAAGYVGQVVGGRYRVDSIVALGGMGAVFRAEHVHMRKQVALKLLHPSIQNLPELVTRFERESIVGAHVQHPNVCQATDFGRLDDGSHYLVLEYVEGKTLHELLKNGPIDPPRAAEIAAQIAAGLGAAHRLGIVHRDVKPANMIISDEAGGQVKIVDFGLAKLPAGRFHIDEKLSVTTAGMVFGTVSYMAPELSKGMVAVDHRSDLYALGVILYEMLAGKHPFDAKDSASLFRMHCKVPPPPIVERSPGTHVPPALEAVVLRLLEKDPADRYQSADEVIEALQEACPAGRDGEPSRGSPNPSGEEAAAEPASLPREAPERADPIEAGPLSDASPPPAPANTERPAAPSKRGGGALRWIGLTVVVLGGAAAAWSYSRTQVTLGAPPPPSPPSAAPAATRSEPVASAMPSPRASASTVASATPSASPAASEAKAAPAVSSAAPPLSAEAVRLRAQMNEAAASRNAKRGADALAALAKEAPSAFRDRDLIAEAASVAVVAALDPQVAGDVFSLLSGPTLGEGGPDVLFHIVSFYGGSRGATRAAELLATPEVLGRASPGLRVARDLKQLPCKDRGTVYGRAADEGDERALTLLMAMLAAGCDEASGACCAQSDVHLAAAVTKLRQRLKR